MVGDERRAASFQMPADRHPSTTVAGGGLIRCTTLPSGLRIVTESMPEARSAAFGIWVGIGSQDELPGEAGASHYLEHVLFKGTKSRDALQIASAIDAVGGELNAFTTKEHTCYYSYVLAEDLPLAIDVVSDVVTQAVIPALDVENERGVILEEIAMRDDDQGDLASELFAAALFGDHPLGRPILGSVDSVQRLDREQIVDYYRSHYDPSVMVASAAGRVDHDQVVEMVSAAFKECAPTDLAARPSVITPAAPTQPIAVLNRPGEQAHVFLGSLGFSRHDDRRFALDVLNNALGGGMSSRLFQEVREQRGLAYSIYSYASHYADTGVFGVYAGCQPTKLADVLAIIRDQLALIADKGLTDAEIARGKGQARGGLVLGLEDPGSRMNRIGKGELVYNEVLSVDELLAKIDAVTADDIRELAAELYARPRSLAIVGPCDETDPRLAHH